ncbi:hypothetical protein NDU88_004969 [Pleurodeles waltl]|uniref:Uncharacterized protein n=1 Tax=Pleurodeles waltl TaxID=8319 RepID=A0AAV7UHK8_PLEWA|nr:hypothetical protein NDU88_004969 [Pleurodeles waltl]
MILQRLEAMHDLVQDTKASIDGMHHDLHALMNDFQKVANGLTEAEMRIGTSEDSASSEKTRMEAATYKNKVLMKDISELEDQNCIANLLIFGLLGSVDDDPNSCVEFLEAWLLHNLGIKFDRDFEIERVQRVPMVKPLSNSHPRAMIFRPLRYHHAEILLAHMTKAQHVLLERIQNQYCSELFKGHSVHRKRLLGPPSVSQ